MMYDWNKFGNCISFQLKVNKHMTANNPERVKDYLCKAFENFDPGDCQHHPCSQIIGDAVKYLNKMGWQAGIIDWGNDIGAQFTCVSPRNEWYRSHFNH